MKARHPARRFDAGHVGQFQKTIWTDAHAETPTLRLAGLEIREALLVQRIHKNIAGLAIQMRTRAGQSCAESFQHLSVHRERTASIFPSSHCSPARCCWSWLQRKCTRLRKDSEP